MIQNLADALNITDIQSRLVDIKWLVIAQEPEPGAAIGEGDATLFVVKYGEPGSETCS